MSQESQITRRTFMASTATALGAVAALTAGRAEARTGKPAGTTDVIVVGAGLSGLYATLLLEEMGYKVTLLEGRNRVGGKVYTMDDVPGAPEGGAGSISANYARLLDVVNRYGVELVPARNQLPFGQDSMMNLGGENIFYNQWEGHARNPFPDAFRATLPWRVAGPLIAKDNPLTRTEQFVDPAFAKYEMSMYQYLRSKGFDDASIKLAHEINPGSVDETGAHGSSLLVSYSSVTFGKLGANINAAGFPRAAKGGNLRIPEGMARHVKTEIQMNSNVVGIVNGKDYAEVFLDDGRSLKGKRVIVTVPFSALRLMKLDAPIHPLQSEAINTLGYAIATHLSFVPKRKFWELDGLPPSMWTDGPAGRVAPLRNNPKDPNEITTFWVLCAGANARYIDRMTQEEGTKYILDYLARIRPSTKGALELVKFWSWQQDRFGCGTWASWHPGQPTKFGNEMRLPAGRIHFAGEHTSLYSRGMEGAMESGERAAFEAAGSL